MRELSLLLVLALLALLLTPRVNPKGLWGRIGVLFTIAVALVAAAALLPGSFRTSMRDYLTPGQVAAIASLALGINVFLVCAALYGVAKFYPRVDPRHITMTLVALLSLVFVLSMSYWTLSEHAKGCMNEPLTKLDALYFTLTTLTTTGFGDFHPTTEVCRGLVSGQLIIGFVVITFVVGILISRAANALTPNDPRA